MPFIKLQFKPGITRDTTNYSNEGGWWDGDKIRFYSGYPQKIGGWLKYTAETMLGTCRQMWGWLTSFNDNFVSFGTNIKLYIDAGGNLYDITPLRATYTTATTPSTNNCFETDGSTNVVVVNLTAHGAITGTYVTFSGATAVGGVPAGELNTEHVVTYIDANSFSITVTTPSTSAVAAGGGTAIVAAFQINPGYPGGTYGYGWGTGTWGRGTWGSGSTTPYSLAQTDWIFTSYDNDLVANRRDGGKGAIYYWERGALTDPAIALATRAVLLSSLGGASAVPAEAGQVLLAQNDRHLIAFGATPFGGGDYDPLLIRWSDQDNIVNWTPSATNSAGFYRLSNIGSLIVQALPTRQETLIFTDASLTSMQFTGTTDVYSFQPLANNISIASTRAATAVDNLVFWMGVDKFYAYSGRVETLPCTIKQYVFDNINTSQLAQVISGTNEKWNEVWWFYPSENSTTNDKYVIFNYLEKIWYFGTLERTAWLDNPLRPYPQAVGGTHIYNHEQGLNDDTLPINAYITSADYDISEGDKYMLMYRMIPDLSFNESTAASPTATFSVVPRNFPGGPQNQDPFNGKNVIETTATQYTEQIFIRARGRQMAFKIESDGLDTQWQLGSPRVDIRPDGKR